MFKCEWCKSKIDGTAARSTSTLAHICEKCKKNEDKYGKPNTCKYCHLRAAFLDSKCVHCAYSERKLGPPVQCSKCQLSAAFPKDPKFKNNKNLLCRLCKAQAISKLKHAHPTYTAATASAKKRKSLPLRLDSGASSKKLRVSTDNNTSGADAFSSEQVLAISVLKDQITSLQKQLTEKDRQLIERDKTNASLNAQIMHMTRDHRTKVSTMVQQGKDREEGLNKEIRNLTRQVHSLTRMASKRGVNQASGDSADEQSPV